MSFFSVLMSGAKMAVSSAWHTVSGALPGTVRDWVERSFSAPSPRDVRGEGDWMSGITAVLERRGLATQRRLERIQRMLEAEILGLSPTYDPFRDFQTDEILFKDHPRPVFSDEPYLYRINFSYERHLIDPITGKVEIVRESDWVSVSSDRHLSRGEISQRALDVIGRDLGIESPPRDAIGVEVGDIVLEQFLAN